MAKGIKTKGICFNQNSKYHMEVLNWAESQSKNFSGFVFDLLSHAYKEAKATPLTSMNIQNEVFHEQKLKALELL